MDLLAALVRRPPAREHRYGLQPEESQDLNLVCQEIEAIPARRLVGA